nr:AlpA family phage regulatory protein [Vibrio breoganii]PMK38735.1 hypothetical protein BCU00_03425 [Vibrio breoganii]
MQQFMKISKVPTRLGISKPSLYRWIKDGKFPPPVQLGHNTSVITEGELSQYMQRVMAGESREQITKDIEIGRKDTSLLTQ